MLSVLVNAPLLDRANANITPNPSKAPWYFLNLQELLLHMDKGLAGVIVPTVALIVLMAIPYIDRSNDGQGTWFGTANAVRITVFSVDLLVVRHPVGDPLGRRRARAHLPAGAGDVRLHGRRRCAGSATDTRSNRGRGSVSATSSRPSGGSSS